MKEKLLFLLLVSVISVVLAVSCSDEESEDTGQANVKCNSNMDCGRDSYCDLENPKQDADLGMLVYYCKKRQLCATQADCPINWKCKVSEGFCITTKEADGILCKSNDDCQDPAFPVCNLATGECETPDGGGQGGESELPDSVEDEDSDPGTNDSEPEDSDSGKPDEDNSSTPEQNDNDNDKDTDTDDEDSSTPSVGEVIMSDGFESEEPAWTIVPKNSEAPCWEIGAPSGGPEEAHGGSNVASPMLAGSYAQNCNDLLQYNTAVSIPSTGNPEISFYAWVDLNGSGYVPTDYVEVLIKQEGKMWEETTGLYLSADTPSLLSALDNSRTKITKVLGTKYYKFTGDLSTYKGQTIELGFRFTSDDSDEGEGFFLDDIEIAH